MQRYILLIKTSNNNVTRILCFVTFLCIDLIHLCCNILCYVTYAFTYFFFCFIKKAVEKQIPPLFLRLFIADLFHINLFTINDVESFL